MPVPSPWVEQGSCMYSNSNYYMIIQGNTAMLPGLVNHSIGTFVIDHTITQAPVPFWHRPDAHISMRRPLFPLRSYVNDTSDMFYLHSLSCSLPITNEIDVQSDFSCCRVAQTSLGRALSTDRLAIFCWSSSGSERVLSGQPLSGDGIEPVKR
jgi:hypothetical protein